MSSTKHLHYMGTTRASSHRIPCSTVNHVGLKFTAKSLELRVKHGLGGSGRIRFPETEPACRCSARGPERILAHPRAGSSPECAFRRRSAGSSRRSSTVPEPPGGGVGRRFCGWRTKGATAAPPECRPRARPGHRRLDGRTPAQALRSGGSGGCPPPPGAGAPPTETPGRGEGGEAGGSGRFFPA